MSLNFVLWVCRSMHVFSVVVWLGGLMFQGAVALPVIQFENESALIAMQKVSMRFLGFVWMSAWTMLTTGVLMMLLNPRFVWFQYHDQWSVLLGFKQLIFALMVFYAFGYARMLKYYGLSLSNGEEKEHMELYRHRVNQFRTISIFLGITALLLAGAMSLNG